MQNITISNTRATIGKFRQITLTDWQAVQAKITDNNGKATIAASTGRRIEFTRAEVEFITKKYGVSA